MSEQEITLKLNLDTTEAVKKLQELILMAEQYNRLMKTHGNANTAS